MIYNGERLARVEGLELRRQIYGFLKVPEQDQEGDPAVWDARADVDLVVRAGAAPADVFAKLGPELEAKCGLKVRFRLTEEERPVVVARGRFRSAPLDGRPANSVEIYEDVLVKPDGNYTRNRLDLDNMLTRLGSLVGRRVVNQTTPPPAGTGLELDVGDHLTRKAKAKDIERVLKQVAAQTGLTFATEKRKARVLTGTIAE